MRVASHSHPAPLVTGHWLWYTQAGSRFVLERKTMMTLAEIIQDIHACAEDLLMYERKYNILSETFYAAYSAGEEPPDHASVLEWSDWAGAYQIWLRRRQQYQAAIQALAEKNSLMQIIEKAMHREPLPVAA
jgi:hypothetical protein